MINPGGYDTIHLFSDCHPGKDIPNLTKHIGANGAKWESGHLNNIRVFVSERGTSLKGSFAVNRFGTNWQTLNHIQIAEEIEKLSEETWIDWSVSNVTRIDFAQTIIMDHKPSAYYPFLGVMPRLERFTKAKSLYYENQQEKFLFYDKGVQAKANKIATPEHLKGCIALRPELSLLKPKRLLKKIITGKDLTGKDFTHSIAQRYWDRYDSIQKLKPIRFNMDTIRTPKDFLDRLEALAIDHLGMDNVSQMIDELKAKRTFSNPKAYSRLSNRIKELSGSEKHTNGSPLLDELTRKIREVL